MQQPGNASHARGDPVPFPSSDHPVHLVTPGIYTGGCSEFRYRTAQIAAYCCGLFYLLFNLIHQVANWFPDNDPAALGPPPLSHSTVLLLGLPPQLVLSLRTLTFFQTKRIGNAIAAILAHPFSPLPQTAPEGMPSNKNPDRGRRRLPAPSIVT